MKKLIVLLMALSLGGMLAAAEHPMLLLTRGGVKEMKAARGSVPTFDKSLDRLVADADKAVEREICLPVPKDGGGGYSHEMHKQKYAEKVRKILFAYVDFYPSLDFHPLGLSSNPGRIFWQTLNESVFLVHTSVAYDCIYDFLSKKDRKTLEEKFFRPYADFIMTGLPHNRPTTSAMRYGRL